MGLVGFFSPLLGSDKMFSPTSPLSFAQSIEICVFETSRRLLQLGTISKQVQEKPKGALVKSG